MNRSALLLFSALALAAPATAAGEPPEWTDCKLTSVPKRISMDKAIKRGIPASFVCSRDVKAFLPARIDEPWAEREIGDDRYAAAFFTDFLDVEAGEKRRVKLRVAKGRTRKVLRRHATVKLIVDMAADRGTGMRSHSKYGKHVTLVR